MSHIPYLFRTGGDFVTFPKIFHQNSGRNSFLVIQIQIRLIILMWYCDQKWKKNHQIKQLLTKLRINDEVHPLQHKIIGYFHFFVHRL